MNISKLNHQECVLILLLETTQLAVWRIDPAVPKVAPTPTEPDSFSSFLSDSASFFSIFLIFPSLSLAKCYDTTVPSLLVTWTASWVSPLSSYHLWHWWTLFFESVQFSVSWERPRLSCHLWIWWYLPSLSFAYTVSWGLPYLSFQLCFDPSSSGLPPALLFGVWKWPDSDLIGWFCLASSLLSRLSLSSVWP